MQEWHRVINLRIFLSTICSSNIFVHYTIPATYHTIATTLQIIDCLDHIPTIHFRLKYFLYLTKVFLLNSSFHLVCLISSPSSTLTYLASTSPSFTAQIMQSFTQDNNTFWLDKFLPLHDQDFAFFYSKFHSDVFTDYSDRLYQYINLVFAFSIELIRSSMNRRWFIVGSLNFPQRQC